MQSYKNHVHRPVLTGVGYLCVGVALVSLVRQWRAVGAPPVALLALTGAVIVLLQISRRYITRLQDRIIKLEMRVRTALLLTPEQQRLLSELDNKQIAALRFASDLEMPALIERTAREKMQPGAIKRAITTWVPDLDRT